MTIVEHLRAQAAHWHKRFRFPVVGIDVLAGDKRAKHCEDLADQVEGMDEAAALQHLISIRDRLRVNDTSSMTLVFSMGEVCWFQELVDMVARENVGFIRVSRGYYKGRQLNLPCYQRMLGINQVVTSCQRNEGESDEVWLARRAEWLGRWHPDVPVKHSERRWTPQGSQEIDLGTVASFIPQEHLVEAHLIALRGWKFPDGVHFEMVEALFKPTPQGAIARIRQTQGRPVRPGIMEMRGEYKVEVLAG